MKKMAAKKAASQGVTVNERETFVPRLRAHVSEREGTRGNTVIVIGTRCLFVFC